nr:MAG TPA: regulatory protein [Caudoviricetes sp.]
MKKLVKIEKYNENGYVVSSRVISNELGKRHSDVKESIENIIKNQSTEISADLKKVIFANIYKDSRNRTYKEYLLTKDGFILYMFNIQGHIDFKMAYINEFNRMEKELQDKRNHILPFEEDKEGVKHMKEIYKSKERMEIALNEYKYNLIIGKSMIENALLDIKNSGFKTNKMSVYFDGKGYNTVKSFLEFE